MVSAEMLAQIPFFHGLAPTDLRQLAASIRERRYAKGNMIFHQGEPGEAAYLVREGRVKVYQLSPGGQEQLMGVFGPPEPFGLVIALDDAPYPSAAEATEESLLWLLPREPLRQLMVAHPAVAARVMGEVGGRLRRAQGRIQALAAYSVQQRLAAYLLELAEAQHQGGPAAGPLPVRLAMTHQELGSYLGASRETITRALAELRRDGAFTPTQDDHYLIDPIQLRHWLER